MINGFTSRAFPISVLYVKAVPLACFSSHWYSTLCYICSIMTYRDTSLKKDPRKSSSSLHRCVCYS
jgi:hypothetical protein